MTMAYDHDVAAARKMIESEPGFAAVVRSFDAP